MANVEKFAKLGLNKEILAVLEEIKFEDPTEIQEKAIPLALKGKDIIGGSATGSGKTLAFAAPIIQNITSNNFVQALILTPTRELAEQVSESVKKFAKKSRLEVLAVYGGVGIEPQMRKLSTTDIVVGTPGRILDHLNRKTLRLDHVKFLVLDEVDRMFDMGFQRDVEKIINHCPKQRQTMLFSATVSREIDWLAKKHTDDAIEIAVESLVDPKNLKQVYYDVPSPLKFSLLAHLLKKEDSELVMVFCSSRRNVDFVARNLKNIGVSANPIHGGMSQNKRSKMLKGFHNSKVDVLICTDVAARGLDISGVSHVYNYDLPKTSDDYIHRIGRTARAGKSGIAINLLCDKDYENFGRITRNENLQIERVEMPHIEKIETKRNFSSQGRGEGYGRRFNNRSSGKSQNRRGSKNFSRR